jgi:polyphosphate kinase
VVISKRVIKKTRKNAKRKASSALRSKMQKDEVSAVFSKEFTNRDIGWLNFNFRVLQEATDSRNPLLERVKFLSISSSNLDEFIMKRVGRLKKQLAYGISTKSSDGQTPSQQLTGIRKSVIEMIKSLGNSFKDLKQELIREDILLLKWSELNSSEKEQIRLFYLKNVFPVLTPLSVDPGHQFPFEF